MRSDGGPSFVQRLRPSTNTGNCVAHAMSGVCRRRPAWWVRSSYLAIHAGEIWALRFVPDRGQIKGFKLDTGPVTLAAPAQLEGHRLAGAASPRPPQPRDSRQARRTRCSTGRPAPTAALLRNAPTAVVRGASRHNRAERRTAVPPSTPRRGRQRTQTPCEPRPRPPSRSRCATASAVRVTVAPAKSTQGTTQAQWLSRYRHSDFTSPHRDSALRKNISRRGG